MGKTNRNVELLNAQLDKMRKYKTIVDKLKREVVGYKHAMRRCNQLNVNRFIGKNKILHKKIEGLKRENEKNKYKLNNHQTILECHANITKLLMKVLNLSKSSNHDQYEYVSELSYEESSDDTKTIGDNDSSSDYVPSNPSDHSVIDDDDEIDQDGEKSSDVDNDSSSDYIGSDYDEDHAADNANDMYISDDDSHVDDLTHLHNCSDENCIMDIDVDATNNTEESNVYDNEDEVQQKEDHEDVDEDLKHDEKAEVQQKEDDENVEEDSKEDHEDEDDAENEEENPDINQNADAIVDYHDTNKSSMAISDECTINSNETNKNKRTYTNNELYVNNNSLFTLLDIDGNECLDFSKRSISPTIIEPHLNVEVFDCINTLLDMSNDQPKKKIKNAKRSSFFAK
jgi:hypothetical protein